MDSKYIPGVWENGDDVEVAKETLDKICENICTLEKCTPKVSNSTMPVVKSEETNDGGCTRIGGDDFVVSVQTGTFDKNNTLKRVVRDSDVTNKIQGAEGSSNSPVPSKDMITSSRLETPEHGTPLENNANMSLEVNSALNNNECVVGTGNASCILGNCAATTNVANLYPKQCANLTELEILNCESNLENAIQSDTKYEMKSDFYNSQGNKDVQNIGLSLNSTERQSGYHTNASDMEKSCSSLSNGKETLAAGETATPTNDVVYALSVVENNMKDIEISNRSTNGRAQDHQSITNDHGNEVIDVEKPGGVSLVMYSDESDSDGSSSSSSSSSDDSGSEEDAGITRAQIEGEERSLMAGPPRTKDEICLSDLPKLEPLDIWVDETVELKPLGEIESILSEDAVVIIKSFENVPAVDSDSILFLENKCGFGRVFEIFGQVRCPHYCVRFNNDDEIKSTEVDIGQTVYFAPDTKDCTNFVFVSRLKGIKGSDASWQYDQEPPTELVEYSDDEAESLAKSAKKKANKLKKRNEAHMQGSQKQELPEADTNVKKQRPSRPAKSNGPVHGNQFIRPPHQLAPPRLRILPQFNPRGPPFPRPGNQHMSLFPSQSPPVQMYPLCPAQPPPKLSPTGNGPPPQRHSRPPFGPPCLGLPPHLQQGHNFGLPTQTMGPMEQNFRLGQNVSLTYSQNLEASPQNLAPPPQIDVWQQNVRQPTHRFGQPYQNVDPPHLEVSSGNGQFQPGQNWAGPSPNESRTSPHLAGQPWDNAQPNEQPVDKPDWLIRYLS